MLPEAPIDLVAYLLLVQLLPLIGLWKLDSHDPTICRTVLVAQLVLIVVFFAVWGGYGKDSWEYLPGFDQRLAEVDSDWLFWGLGIALNRVLYDPWPLKLVSVLIIAVLCSAILSYFGQRSHRCTIAALWALLLIPATFLLAGSAVRQGLAGALVIFGFVYPCRQRNALFAAAGVLAFLVHDFSVVLTAALAFARLSTLAVRYTLVLAPLLCVVGYWLGTIVPGLDLTELVPHADKSEGAYHWEKFFVAYAITITALILTDRKESGDKQLVAGYGYMVSASALFVIYEVPFERLLGFSELLLPFVAALVVDAIGWERRRLVCIWLAGTGAGILLWSHPSIVETLGYNAPF